MQIHKIWQRCITNTPQRALYTPTIRRVYRFLSGVFLIHHNLNLVFLLYSLRNYLKMKDFCYFLYLWPFRSHTPSWSADQIQGHSLAERAMTSLAMYFWNGGDWLVLQNLYTTLREIGAFYWFWNIIHLAKVYKNVYQENECLHCCLHCCLQIANMSANDRQV